MGRRFDPEAIAELAKKVGGLQDSFTKTGSDLGDGDPGGAYGDLGNAASAGETTQGFYRGVNAQMGAAAKLVDAASRALSEAASGMQSDEDEGVHTFGGRNAERA